MSLLAQGVIALALMGVQEGKGDSKQKQDATPEEQAQVLLAVRNETELRDFGKALESWTLVRTSAEKSGSKELVVKAELGRARCLQALGRTDEAKSALKAVLTTDPKNGEAHSLVAKFLAGGQDGDELKEIVRQLADVALGLTSAQDEKRAVSASNDLVRMSDVTVPLLADLLRDNRVGVVDGAAGILARIKTVRSFGAIAVALRDPASRYPEVIANHVNSAGSQARDCFEAMVSRPEPEIRRVGALRLCQTMGEQPTDAQVALVKRLLADADDRIRLQLASLRYDELVAKSLASTFQDFIDSKEERSLKLGAAFLTSNRERLAPDMVSRWSALVLASPFASVRLQYWQADYEVAMNRSRSHAVDSRRRTAVLLRVLSDEDPSVVGWGANALEEDGGIGDGDVPTASHDALLGALRNAIEASGVSLARRFIILTRLPRGVLSDDELFDLFAGLAEKPVEADAEWRANAREPFAKDLLSRHGDGGGREAVAAKWILRIPDVAGRRLWWALSPSNNSGNRLSALEVAKTDDVAFRLLAYRELASGVAADALPHLREDLRSSDPALVLAAAKVIGWGERPELVVPLRELLAHGSGELHDAALRALANVGGKDVADELLAAMRATPKEGQFPFLRELERGIGAERLAKELVALAQAYGTSERIVWWMRTNNEMCVSTECASAFVRELPKELVGRVIFDWLANYLSIDVLSPLICRRLREGSGDEVESAARMVRKYHIEAAWPDLVALLDRGVGQSREAAINALEALREFRELKRTFAADDSDARRAAFDKAKAMTSSKSAEQRAGAAIALAATGDIAAISPLLDLLGDGDESVRVAARKALEKLADRAALPPAEPSKSGDEKKKQAH